MAVNLSGGCFCCGGPSTNRMDIDAALDELGMLSTVTESRKQYLQERMRTRSESGLISKHSSYSKSSAIPSSTASSTYQIVHIDTNYVTGFSDQPKQDCVKDSSSIADSEFSNEDVYIDHAKEYRTPPFDNVESMADKRRKMRLKYRREDISARNRRILARKRARQPYEVPWRLTQSFQENLLNRHDDIPESKSNSSSPVKPINPDTLTRSRSLDNIDFSTFFISENADRREIDNVASELKNLNVSDT
ncbi:hypothetical protein ACF0H5_022483 [Mactra antiquata]